MTVAVSSRVSLPLIEAFRALNKEDPKQRSDAFLVALEEGANNHKDGMCAFTLARYFHRLGEYVAKQRTTCANHQVRACHWKSLEWHVKTLRLIDSSNVLQFLRKDFFHSCWQVIRWGAHAGWNTSTIGYFWLLKALEQAPLQEASFNKCDILILLGCYFNPLKGNKKEVQQKAVAYYRQFEDLQKDLEPAQRHHQYGNICNILVKVCVAKKGGLNTSLPEYFRWLQVAMQRPSIEASEKVRLLGLLIEHYWSQQKSSAAVACYLQALKIEKDLPLDQRGKFYQRVCGCLVECFVWEPGGENPEWHQLMDTLRVIMSRSFADLRTKFAVYKELLLVGTALHLNERNIEAASRSFALFHSLPDIGYRPVRFLHVRPFSLGLFCCAFLKLPNLREKSPKDPS